MSRPGHTPNALIELDRQLFHIFRELPMDSPAYPILSETAVTLLKKGVFQMLTNRVTPAVGQEDRSDDHPVAFPAAVPPRTGAPHDNGENRLQ